ncbi:MAG: hypothetical protein ACP5OR_08605 [Candidatus Dormibacteria bacterium]
MCAEKCANSQQRRKGHGIEELIKNNPTKKGSIPWLQVKHTTEKTSLTALVKEDADLMKMLVKETLQAFLEEEMDDCIGADPFERTKGRLSGPSEFSGV